MRFVGLDTLKRLEGCRLNAYRDEAGVWTIGYGHTNGVRPGDVWTQAHADAMVELDVQTFIGCVERMLKGVPPLTNEQFSALVIFAFNVGCMALAGSTAMREVRAGRLDAVPEQLARWCHVHDRSGVPVVSEGLVKRRAAEAALWRTT